MTCGLGFSGCAAVTSKRPSMKLDPRFRVGLTERAFGLNVDEAFAARVHVIYSDYSVPPPSGASADGAAGAGSTGAAGAATGGTGGSADAVGTGAGAAPAIGAW